MAFQTSAAIQGDEFGKVVYDKSTKSYQFISYGRAAFIEKIIKNLETDSFSFELSSVYLGRKRYVTVPQELMADKKAMMDKVYKIGVRMHSNQYDTFCDSLRLQEDDIQGYGISLQFEHKSLGWIQLPIYDTNGIEIGTTLCYRAHNLIGQYNSTYTGCFDVEPKGSLEKWVDMLNSDIIGHLPAETAMVVGLSSIIVGAISLERDVSNILCHIVQKTSTGKTSLCRAIAAAIGSPFSGVYHKDGKDVEGCCQNWSSTPAALLKTFENTVGSVIVLNELSQSDGKDLKEFIFNASSGNGKKRLNQRMEVITESNFKSTIISCGEYDITEDVNDKVGGLFVRILNIRDPMCKSAEQADRIVNICSKNYGWVAPAMASHIIKNGGVKYVTDICDRWYSTLVANKPDTNLFERFASSILAPVLTTADIASKALDVRFNTDLIKDYLVNNYVENIGGKNVEQDSFAQVVEICRMNIGKFYTDRNTIITGEVWGRYEIVNQVLPGGRILLEEFMIRTKPLELILKKLGYKSVRICASEWKQRGLLAHDDDTHNTDKRKVDPKSIKNERVYVLQIFDESGNNNCCDNEVYTTEYGINVDISTGEVMDY